MLILQSSRVLQPPRVVQWPAKGIPQNTVVDQIDLMYISLAQFLRPPRLLSQAPPPHPIPNQHRKRHLPVLLRPVLLLRLLRAAAAPPAVPQGSPLDGLTKDAMSTMQTGVFCSTDNQLAQHRLSKNALQHAKGLVTQSPGWNIARERLT